MLTTRGGKGNRPECWRNQHLLAIRFPGLFLIVQHSLFDHALNCSLAGHLKPRETHHEKTSTVHVHMYFKVHFARSFLNCHAKSCATEPKHLAVTCSLATGHSPCKIFYRSHALCNLSNIPSPNNFEVTLLTSTEHCIVLWISPAEILLEWDHIHPSLKGVCLLHLLSENIFHVLRSN